MFYKLFNRESSKTTAKPSRVRVSQHVTAKKVASGQHNLTPDRIARITASAKQREYRERQKNFPRQEIDSAATVDATEQEQQDTVAPLHDLSGKQQLANSGTSEGAHKGWETRRSGGETVVTVKGEDDAEKTKNLKGALKEIGQSDANYEWHKGEPLYHGNPTSGFFAKQNVHFKDGGKLANGKPCGASHIPDDAVCRIGEAATVASEKARTTEKPEDHRAAAEAHSQAYMELQRRRDNKPSSPETRADATRMGHHQAESKRHNDAAAKIDRDVAHAKKLVTEGPKDIKDGPMVDRINRHAKEMAEAKREYASVAADKESKNPEAKAKHDAAYERIKAAHSEQQSIAAKMDGFDDVKKWFEHKRGKMANDARVLADLDSFIADALDNAGERLGIALDATDKLSNRFSVPSDGWIHLAPFGSHPHPTGVVQQIDAKSVDSMVANFAARKASDKNFTGALLDFDHFSQSGDKPSEAGGWIENLAKREDGMWGQVRWTDVGEKAVNGGRYRLVSPVWLKRNCETLDNGNLRPLVLDSVALTNEPNLKGLTPISR